ncbi:MAG: hypothetical protein U5R49_05370 [Deltaproteobacteria bacterium]|nr:hypothetical protein [Deltaproteobacteria bacterium]
MDDQEERIASIFNMDEVPEVSEETLKPYLQYIKDNMDDTCEITGIEDFEWEEYYIIGPGSKKEHEELRKTYPSYMDIYKVIEFEEDPDEEYGILVSLKRTSDGKTFTLPLADLTAKDKKHPSYRMLDDYAVWFVNWK